MSPPPGVRKPRLRPGPAQEMLARGHDVQVRFLVGRITLSDGSGNWAGIHTGRRLRGLGQSATTSACVPSPEVPPAGVRRVLRAVRAAPAKRGRRSDPEPHSLSRIGRADRRRCPSPFHPVRNISRGDLFGRAVRFVSEPGRPADHRQDEQFHELRLWLQQFRRALRLSTSRVVVVGCLFVSRRRVHPAEGRTVSSATARRHREPS